VQNREYFAAKSKEEVAAELLRRADSQQRTPLYSGLEARRKKSYDLYYGRHFQIARR
jgi:hypothetical protein